MSAKRSQASRRAGRVRRAVKAAAKGRLRLSVHRTPRHIYAQLIDDSKGSTLVSASTLDSELRGKLKASGNAAAAGEVGKLIGKRAVEAGFSKAAFDRGGFLFHGRVKALADGARESGLEF